MSAGDIRSLLLVGAAIAALAGVAGLVALWWHVRATGFRPAIGEEGRVVASDTGVVPPMMLRDPLLGIRGRPDYLVEEGLPGAKRLVPVEVKPTRRSRRLYESDKVQLGAYLLALRGTVGERASTSGIVRYATASFRVELDAELEERLRELTAALRQDRDAAVVHRSHSIPARCAGCPMRPHCDESLS